MRDRRTLIAAATLPPLSRLALAQGRILINSMTIDGDRVTGIAWPEVLPRMVWLAGRACRISILTLVLR